MKHIDQHTLELFLLGSPDLELSRNQIERHLAKCQGCRDLYDEITLYYRRAAENYERSEVEPKPQDKAIVERPRHRDVSPWEAVPPPTRPFVSAVRGVFAFVRVHPVVTAGTSLTLALALFGAITLTSRQLKDSNPSYYHINPAEGKIEIFNKQNDKLWDIPAKGAEEAAGAEIRDQLEAVRVVDLDMDGKNEVVTTVRGVGAYPADAFSLCIFASDGHLKKRTTFERSVKFHEREYSDTHLSCGIVTGEFSSDGRKEILCRAFTGWSPSAILRFDRNGELLGEYWHYGHITQLVAVDVHHGGKLEILAAGSDDLSDSVSGSGFAVVGLLAPEKIVGQTEATTTPGFGYVPSSAEQAFVQLPNTRLNLTFRSKPGIQGLNVNPSGSGEFANLWWSSQIDGEKLLLEYVLGPDLQVQDVRTTDNAVRLLARLEKESRISSDEARKMIPALLSKVKYWDGREWQLQSPSHIAQSQ